LIPYVFSTLSFGLFVITDRYGKVARFGYLTAAIIALTFSLWAIVGSGLNVVLWGLVLLAAGVPIFFWMKKRN
jgi:APA family basic amino acid/polyamine antiporter